MEFPGGRHIPADVGEDAPVAVARRSSLKARILRRMSTRENRERQRDANSLHAGRTPVRFERAVSCSPKTFIIGSTRAARAVVPYFWQRGGWPGSVSVLFWHGVAPSITGSESLVRTCVRTAASPCCASFKGHLFSRVI